MTVTLTVMQEVTMKRAEQAELDLWLDTHPICAARHSPGSRPLVCARCLTLNEWDRLNDSIERLLRYGGTS